VIHDVDAVVKRAVQLASEKTVVAINGSVMHLAIETICVHSDTEGADVLARRIREGLEAAGIRVTAIGS
jgi:UPF0271 protein